MTCKLAQNKTMSLQDANTLLLTCMFLAAIKDGSGQVSPLNVVSVVGEETIFNCTTLSQVPDWILSRDGNSTDQLVITTGCIVNPGLRNRYRTEQQGPLSTCNLIVFDITVDQAGVYRCTENITHYALLTVIDPVPSITPNTSKDVMENETLIITCTSNYNGSAAPAPTLKPYFRWTDASANTVLSSYDSTTETVAVSKLTITADRQDIMPYTCQVYLNLTTSAIDGYANNTPIVNTSASSPRFRVLLASSTSTALSTASETPTSTAIVTPTILSTSSITSTRSSTTTPSTTVKPTTITTTTPTQPATLPTTLTTKSTTKSTTAATRGTTFCPCGITTEPQPINTSNGAATAMGVLFAFSFAANIALTVLVIWFWKFREPKKNVETKMTDLSEIQPTAIIYEPLRQPDPDDTNTQPVIYQKLQKPIAFNPKTDIPKAIASKNASNTVEAFYVE